MAPTSQQLVKELVILGGGTAGWMTAAALARSLNGKVAIRLVESEQIGTVGVGEATIPSILRFNQLLDLDEGQFLRDTMGTIKLGIEFVDWKHLGHCYMHGFGRLREDIKLATFEQIWQRMRMAGHPHDLSAYSITKVAAYAGRFTLPRPDVPQSPLADIAYAYHFDASLYARTLRRYAEARGVERLEGKVTEVLRQPGGDLAALRLEDGRVVAGDFFVDCSGFRGRLIEQELQAGFDDWSQWLPCNRAVAVASAATRPILPFTRATARPAGWQWRIPLQHRIGNGYVFSNHHVSEDEATQHLLDGLDGPARSDPWVLRFVAGVRRRQWIRNCVAIGLSGGFLEPLESTSIYLIQSGILRLLAFFPSDRPSEPDIAEYNRLIRREYEHIRDFVVLHYHANARNDTDLWRHCAAMKVPDSLRQKIELFKQHARLFSEPEELFAQGSWFQVMHGQGLEPAGYHPIVDVIEQDDLERYFEKLRRAVQECLQVMPTHEDFLRQYGRAPGGVL